MLKYGVCIWLPILERPWWRHATIEKPYTFRFKLTLPAMSNIAFCSKAFGRKTWVTGYENQIIQKKNGFRFRPICSTPVLTTDNIIFFRIDHTDNIIQTLCRQTCSLCRRSMATLFVQVYFDKWLHTLCYSYEEIKVTFFYRVMHSFLLKFICTH